MTANKTFYDDAMARLKRMRLNNTQANGKDLFSITGAQRNAIKEIMLRQIERIPALNTETNRSLKAVANNMPKLKEVVGLLMETPGFWLKKSELIAKCNLKPKHYSALRLISSDEGIGLIVKTKDFVAIDPGAIHFLKIQP